MFEDFGSSGRGPGVIGMLLALLVLAGFSGMAISVYFDDGNENSNSLQAKISENNSDIRIKKETLKGKEEKLELYRGYHKLNTEITLLERRVRQETEELEGLAQKKSTTLSETESLNKEFIEYRNQYRVNERARAVGEKIDLSESLGPDFKVVTILEVTPTALRIRTSSGPKAFEYDKLPLAIQDRFQFSLNEADEFKDKQAAANKRQAALNQQFQANQAAQFQVKKAAQQAQRKIALKIEIDRLKKDALEFRNLAAQFRQNARQHLKDDSASRRSGRSGGLHKSKAEADQKKADDYEQKAEAADKKAKQLQIERNKL